MHTGTHSHSCSRNTNAHMHTDAFIYLHLILLSCRSSFRSTRLVVEPVHAMNPRDVCIDALMRVISKACCNRIRELLADDGDDRIFHFSQCANLNDVEGYKRVVNPLIDTRAARMRIRQSNVVASAFARLDVNNAGLLSRCTTKKKALALGK